MTVVIAVVIVVLGLRRDRIKFLLPQKSRAKFAKAVSNRRDGH